MKKITGVGIGIAVVIISIIIGIVSLPDKVLIESPSFETSQNPSGEEKKITIPSESVSSNEQTAHKEETPDKPAKQTEPENDTKGNVIEIKIKDGVGSKDK